MKKADTMRELILLLRRFPDERVPMLKDIIEALLRYEEQRIEYEDEELSEKELLSLAEADEEILAGRGKPWSQVKGEMGL